MEDMAPPEIDNAPMKRAASNADQNPMNGPNENAKNTVSFAVTPAPRYTGIQQRANHAQLLSVSNQRKGLPAVPDV